MSLDRTAKIGAVLTLAGTLATTAWFAVTRADEVIRHADQVPDIKARQSDHDSRIRDLEGDAARQALALEEIQREVKATNQQQMAMLREILEEVRDGQ